MTLFSFVFGQQDVKTWDIIKVERKIELFRSRISQAEDHSEMLEKEKVTAGSLPLASNDTLYVEFGRLASAMFISESKTIEPNILYLSGNTLIPKKDYPSIISLYDPFTLYNLRSAAGDYVIREVTNGSFYLGREADGTVSVYSIDAVVRLEFLHEGNFMTDMVLFPGMYIRFDPKLNRTLAGADLFRIILSMVSTGDEQAIDRTWVEFVNPRISSSSESDTFFMYRLPTYTRVLFRSLHAEFSSRVKKIEDLKKYSSDFLYDLEESQSSKVSNPAKINHFLLKNLEWLLSQIVSNSKTLEEFRTALEKINNASKQLAKWNDVEKTLEEFLTDARFASFWKSNNAHFQEIYNEIASILGIAPASGKWELLQQLSNIYSLNLSAQIKDKEFSRIDTYSPTAREILSTLSSKDIESKDYFDVALYAFHVLKKAEDGGKFFDEATVANATYDLLSTIFLSTDKYVKSQGDPTAYKSLSIQFYDHLLITLVNSLYSLYTENENDRIYFKKKYVDDGVIKINEKQLIEKLRNLDWVIELLFSSLQKVYANETDLRTFLSIKKSKLRFHAFVKLFDKWKYAEYLLSPYVSIKTDDQSLPKISDDGESLLQAKINEKITTETGLPEDVWMTGIRNLLGNIPAGNLIKEGEYYQVINAEIEALNPTDNSNIRYALSLTFSNDLKTIGNVSVLYNERRINVVTDTKDQELIAILSKVLPWYLASIDSIFAANANQLLSGEIRLFIDKSRIAIGNNIFTL